MMKHARYLPILLMFASLLFWSGCRSSAQEAEAESGVVEPVQVRAAKVTSTTLRPSIDLIGTMTAIPEQTTEISSQVEGQIYRIAVVEGQAVEANTPLIYLDARFAEARLAGAVAAEQKAQAALSRLEHGPRAEEVEVARQTARQLAAVADALRTKLEALTPLHEKGGVSDVEYGQAKARLEAAEAESEAAAAQLSLLEAGSRAEDIAEAGADLAAARAETETARLAVESCTIRSPIAGVVTQLNAGNGAYISQADRLAVVVDMSELFVSVRIPSEHLAHVAPGNSTDVWCGAVSDAPLHGTIARLSPVAGAQTGDVDGYVRVENSRSHLRPGLACRVRIWLPELEDVLTIPAAAVADRDGTPVVTVIRDGRAHEQEVSLGVVTAQHVQVLSGLAAGDLVATEGGYALPEDCPVETMPDAPQTD